MTIGERIKKRRKELELSVDEIAEKLNKNRATVYRYESDEIENLPLTIIEPLSKVLKTTPEYLMGWETADKLGAAFGKLSNIDDEELIDLLSDIPNMTKEQLDMLKAVHKMIKSNIAN